MLNKLFYTKLTKQIMNLIFNQPIDSRTVVIPIR